MTHATAYPNGVVIIHDDLFKVIENEAQLAAVLGHEVAHSTQEHVYRQLQHNKKRRQAIAIASLFAAAMGYYAISNILDPIIFHFPILLFHLEAVSSELHFLNFQMLTIRNSFSSLDFSQLKKGDDEVFERMAVMAYEANPKNKKRIRVIS